MPSFPATSSCRHRRRPIARSIGLVLVLASVLPAGPTFAQSASCPPPQKLAAGACVNQCPGGYEDRGQTCEYRNQSR